MNTLTNQALNTINSYRNNSIIMDFVRAEAVNKVTKEMNDQGRTPTAKGVELLSIRHKNIEQRINDYVNIGLVGCYFASFNKS